MVTLSPGCERSDGCGAVPRFWTRDLVAGIDCAKVILGSQELQLFQTRPASRSFIGQSSVVDIIDKGIDREAILVSRRDLYDKTSGEFLATITQSTF